MYAMLEAVALVTISIGQVRLFCRRRLPARLLLTRSRFGQVLLIQRLFEGRAKPRSSGLATRYGGPSWGV